VVFLVAQNGGFPGFDEVYWHFESVTLGSVEQARGIFYTTQDTLLLTCRGEGSLLVVEGREKRMIIFA